MIRLFQIQVTNEMSNFINQRGRISAMVEYPEYAVRMGAMNGDKVRLSDIEHYADVAQIDTDDLEEAFKISNIGPVEKISFTPSKRASSMSVGDVCEHQGAFYQVMSFGFEELV